MKNRKKHKNMSDKKNSKREKKDENEVLNDIIDDSAQVPGTDTVPEEPVTGEDETIRQESEEKSIEARLAEAESEINDLKDRLLRQMAEFDNYRKRTIKEKAEIIKSGSADIITEILPVIDDMERAIANSGKSGDFDALKEGIELIYNKLMHNLEQKGLHKISPVNEPFDTDYHEAIAMLPATDESKKGLVVDCAIDGYIFNDKVLRHAKVAVAQ